MAPRIKAVVLCEDQGHQQFLRGWLSSRGIRSTEVRWSPLPLHRSSNVGSHSEGSGSGWVRQHHAAAIATHREERGRKIRRPLIVMVDADRATVAATRTALETIAPRVPDDLVATPIPKWNVETWALHLLGEKTDETRSYKYDFERHHTPHDLHQAGGRLGSHKLPPGTAGAVPSLVSGRTELETIKPHLKVR